MISDLQRAMIWKRISAWLLDAILLGILAVGFGFCISWLTGYEGYSEALSRRYDAMEQKYGVSLSITQQEYEAFSPEKQQAFQAASQALSEDPDAQQAYNMMISLSLVISSLGILFACLILEFLVPLGFGNGQTLGKKIFSVGVMSVNGVRVSRIQMFIRAILGKYTLEIMLPVLVGTLSFFGSLGIYGTGLIFALGLLQLILLFATYNRSLIHDLLSGTVVIDLPSQMIFETEAEKRSYIENLESERKAHPYD